MAAVGRGKAVAGTSTGLRAIARMLASTTSVMMSTSTPTVEGGSTGAGKSAGSASFVSKLEG